MYKNNKIAVIIPARGGSKGIPKKNIINFCGKKLIAWSIEQSLNSRYVDYIFVSSDDEDILSIAKRCGARTIKRPRSLATDNSSTEDALLHAVGNIEDVNGIRIDVIILLQATSPVRAEKDIDGAVVKFFSKNADSLFSAALLDDFCAWQIRNGKYESVTYDYKNRGKRQDRDAHYLENGSIYIFKTGILKKYKNRFGGNIATYIMPFWKSFEIDKPEDIEICEYFMKERILKGKDGQDRVSLKDVKLAVYDFDGVLTDNKVVVNEKGLEAVTVNRGDGLAIGLLKKKGLKQIILTTETNRVVKARARKLNIPILSGVGDKRKVLLAYCMQKRIDLRNVIYVGNDINDLEAMKIVGYPFCPIDASEEIKGISRSILNASGGGGVIRDLVNHLNMVK